jgi:hypothetical protein
MEGPKNYVHAADTSASEVRIAIEKYKRIHLQIVVRLRQQLSSSMTASVVYWTEFLATDLEVLDSIPGATRFSEK